MAPVKFRETNAADDSKGEFFGLEGKLAYWPAGALFAGVLIFSVLTRSFHGGYLSSALFCFTPGVLVAVVCFTMINHKPPGHFSDWLATHLLGATSASYRPGKQPKKYTKDL